MTFVIDANLDQEMRWGGTSLPAQIRARLSAISALLSILAPLDERDIEVWTLAPMLVARLHAVPGWTPPTLHYGPRPDVDLKWADPAAQRFNDRTFALFVAGELGVALPGARTIASLDELEDHLAAGGGAAGRDGGAWVCKARWTSAGRDRCFGTGPALSGEERAHLAVLLQRESVVFEPWLQRVVDVGVCGHIADRRVTVDPPHRLLTSERGTFRGIALAVPQLAVAEHDILVMTAERVGYALLDAGYTGPFGVDAFVYVTGTGRRRLHPLCEINARYTFGHVARAFDERIGIATLAFGTNPPHGATQLVLPGGADRSRAWITSSA